MSRPWLRFRGADRSGDFVEIPRQFYHRLAHGQATRDNFDTIAKGLWCRNVPVGGGTILCSGAGDVSLPLWAPVEIDDTDGRLSAFADVDGAVVVVRFRYLIRVSDTGLVITPKLFYGTDLTNPSTTTTAATISGEFGCSADDEDFSGLRQYQFVTVTLPGGGIASLWRPAVTVGGTIGSPAPSADVRAFFDCFVRLP